MCVLKQISSRALCPLGRKGERQRERWRVGRGGSGVTTPCQVTPVILHGVVFPKEGRWAGETVREEKRERETDKEGQRGEGGGREGGKER